MGQHNASYVSRCTELAELAKPVVVRNKGGRPRFPYDPVQVDEILTALASGGSLRKTLASNPAYPSIVTFLGWVEEDKDGLRTKYARARAIQAEVHVDQMQEIADDGSNDTYVDSKGNTQVDYDVLGRSKLRLEQRRWYAEKLLPKKYGAKVEVEAKVGLTINVRRMQITE